MSVKRRRARLLEIAQDNDGGCGAAQACLHRSAQSRTSSKHPIGIHAGRSSARSVRQRAGAALHAFILTCACRCLLPTRLGNAALIPAGHLNYAPNLLNTLACDQVIRPVMWRHSKMLRVLQQHHSCALPPAMALSAAHGRSQSVLYLKMFETDYESLVADGSDKFARFFRC